MKAKIDKIRSQNASVLPKVVPKTTLVDKFWQLIGKYPIYPPLNNYSLFVFTSGHNTKKYFDKVLAKSAIEYHLINTSNSDQKSVFLPQKVFDTLSKEAFSSYLASPKSLKERENQFYSQFKEMDDLYAQYTYGNIQSATHQELTTLMPKILDIIWSANAVSHFTIIFDKQICQQVITEAQFPLLQKDLDAVWEFASTSISRSFDCDNLLTLLRFVSKKTDWIHLVEGCQYFFTSYKNSLSISETEMRIKQEYGQYLDQKTAQKNIEAQLASEKKTQLHFDKIYKKLSIDQRKVVDYCQVVMRIRDNRKNFIHKGLTILWRIAQRFFDEASVSESLIEHIMIRDELANGPAHIKQILPELRLRQLGYTVLVPYDAPLEISYQNPLENHIELQKLFVQSQQVESDSKKRIIGQVGSKGIIQGVARIVTDATKSSHFATGDVLVAGMTRPEYVPLMKRAAAIVTNEGGITCHAAIVSRELKKPCVIGTKIATHIIKDGDLVEVDATCGVVTILQNAAAVAKAAALALKSASKLKSSNSKSAHVKLSKASSHTAVSKKSKKHKVSSKKARKAIRKIFKKRK